MREFESFHEANFEKFGVSLLKNEAINVWKSILTRRKREISSGSSEDMMKLFDGVEDEIFIRERTFVVKGLPIVVNDEAIADVLRFIIPCRRDILLLTYFAEYTDTHISKIMNITCPTVAYRRKIAEKQMKALLECRKYGEKKNQF